MTDKQGTVVVSRELVETWAARFRKAQMFKESSEAQAVLAAPVEQHALQVPEECPLMIVFDDADREPISFAGTGSKQAALKTWAQISNSWNAHLFVRIARNSRDDCYPSATVAPVEQQGEPVAWMDPRSPTMHATISNEVKKHNTGLGGAPASAINGYCIPLYRHAQSPAKIDPDALSNFIREIDGNHALGAGRLAELIAEHLNGKQA